MRELIIQRSPDRIVNKEELLAVFNSLKVGFHRLIIKDARTRSHPQNRYYWGVVIPMVKDGLREAGYDEVRDMMDAHEVVKHLHLRKRIVSKQTGDVIDIAGSSAKLTIPEFNEYIERICRWSAEFLYVVIPAPNQQMIKLAEYIDELEYEMIVDEA
jgi:hypothetical protein